MTTPFPNQATFSGTRGQDFYMFWEGEHNSTPNRSFGQVTGQLAAQGAVLLETTFSSGGGKYFVVF